MAHSVTRAQESFEIASLLTTHGAFALWGRVHWSKTMSIDRPPATVWVDQRPNLLSEAEGRKTRATGSARTLWAERPFEVRGGLCVAVALRGGALLVGFRAAATPSKLEWLPAARVLSDSDAARWARTRFNATSDSQHQGDRP